jgi:class 3 adenylate cyclase
MMGFLGNILDALDPRAIRGRLILAVAVLLALGGLNIAVSYWGARQRDRVFGQLTRAIERQTIVTEVSNRLTDQKKFVDLLASGLVGGATPPIGAGELERFTAAADSIPERLAELEAISEPALRDSVEILRTRSTDLAEAWKAFYANQGVDPSAAVLASVEAEPIAEELLQNRLPAAVEAEKLRLKRASEEFLETDRTVSSVAWASFLLSILLGAGLAVVILRDVFRSIRELKVGAHRIGAGDLDYRIAVRGQNELTEVAQSFNSMAEGLRERTAEIEHERQVSEELLLHILPRQIADELRESGRVEPKYYSDVTIIFADFVGFTRLFDNLSVDRVVRILHQLFTDFDHITRAYELEKLKTVGDGYMAAGGLTRGGASHPVDTILAAFEIIEAVRRRTEEERIALSVRVGLHTGPVAAGVVGIDKFVFDVWGDTVNFAARLEATSTPNKVNISESTYLRVKDFFTIEPRGRVQTKEGKERDMYFVRELHPELVGPGSPPAPFADRYRIYYQHAPYAFPSTLTSPLSTPFEVPVGKPRPVVELGIDRA